MASDILMTPNLAHCCLMTSCIIFVCWLSKPIKADYSHLQCSCLLSPLPSLIQQGNHLICQIFTVPQNLSKIHHNPSVGLRKDPFWKIITQSVLNIFFILMYEKDQVLLILFWEQFTDVNGVRYECRHQATTFGYKVLLKLLENDPT